MLEVGNFQEVTTVDESIKNIAAFSFSVLNSDVVNSSFDLLTNGSVNGSSNLFTSDSLNRDIIQQQWETVNTHSRGLITVMAERDGLQQVEGVMRYRFTVNTTDLGEGPLLLTLYIKLRCAEFSGFLCTPDLYRSKQDCTCTQWQYQGESETISISSKRGELFGMNTTYSLCINMFACFGVFHAIHPFANFLLHLILYVYFSNEVRASQLAQASERVGSLIPASQQG